MSRKAAISSAVSLEEPATCCSFWESMEVLSRAYGALSRLRWQGERVSNPQPAVLETAALPIALSPYRISAHNKRGADYTRPCILMEGLRRESWSPRRRRQYGHLRGLQT